MKLALCFAIALGLVIHIAPLVIAVKNQNTPDKISEASPSFTEKAIFGIALFWAIVGGVLVYLRSLSGPL